MPAPKRERTQAAAVPDWLPKREAAALLGAGTRQLERREKAGFIESRREPRRFNQSTAPVLYSRADILALKAGTPNIHARPEPAAPAKSESKDHSGLVSERETPPPQTALAVRPPSGMTEAENFGYLMATILKAREKPAPKLWLTLAEAVEFTGLRASWLLEEARAGAAFAIDMSRGGARSAWRFSRAGLEARAGAGKP